MPDRSGVTETLKRARHGGAENLGELVPLVYDDLRRLAVAALRGQRPDHAVRPTSLVHETYLRLVDQRKVEWRDRAHFLAIAAQVMRRALVDQVRQHRARKRGGDRQQVTIEDGEAQAPAITFDLLDLNDALRQLGELNERHGRVVELRFFGGMTHKEVAHVLNVSEGTVKSSWQFARAWLNRKLRGVEPDDA